ncbi:MAG TPA: 2-oxoacid:ferredoxin oxidoreductase subunit beta [Blastocatellia bacterium]|nr:2-oxoacid:ferredoxin oxidoreductase subunit beta [Blastocatellia bacterium]
MSTNANIPTSGGNGQTPPVKLTRKDFVSDQEVRWCPGCGDYAILAQIQKVMPELGIKRENVVFVSGIGCSSRFPYYMNTYGFHGIHGRAPAIATGIKVSNPELSVWVITGDGDALSIGGNHLIHAIRRNLDINIVLFNNRIYGLTKGQYSPTSEFGKKTKSTPFGVIDYPLNPLSVALAAEATFVARSVDTFTSHLQMVVERAMHHKGVSFVEVYQNCNIFNDGAFDMFTDKGVKDDRMIELEHGKPLVFGKEKNKGVRITADMRLEVVELGNGVSESELIVHDEKAPDSYLAYMLARMEYPEYPVPIGIFRDVEKASYESLVAEQINTALEKMGPGDLEKLINSGDTWVIE